MFIATAVPYSSTVGQSVLIQKEKDGPVICQLSVRPIGLSMDDFEHKVQSQNLARLIVEKINAP